VAGGTFYKAENVVGLSNVVAEPDDAVAVFRVSAALAANVFPGLPLLGYDQADGLGRDQRRILNRATSPDLGQERE
jgi:hypothetical protein